MSALFLTREVAIAGHIDIPDGHKTSRQAPFHLDAPPQDRVRGLMMLPRRSYGREHKERDPSHSGPSEGPVCNLLTSAVV